MTAQSWFWARGRLPGLNELLASSRDRGRLKAQAGAAVALQARAAGFEPRGRSWTFLFVEPNRRRDFDNVIAGMKVVFDALVNTGLLEDDRRKFVEEIAAHIYVERAPGVLVVADERSYSLDEMVSIWETAKRS